MTNENSRPQGEAEPIGETTNQHDSKSNTDEPALPSIVKPVDTEGDEPKPAETYDETDRKQDETLSAIAQQTEWEAKQTELMEKQVVWARAQTVASTFLGIVTLGVLFYHGKTMSGQLEAMREQSTLMIKSLEETKQTREVDNRAWVGVHSIQEDFNRGYVRVLLENTGHVPAQNVLAFATEARYRDGELGTADSITSSRVTIETGRTRIFPGSFRMPIHVPLKDISPEEITTIQRGAVQLQIILQIEYGDGFGNRDTSRFVFRYSPSTYDKWEVDTLRGNFPE